MDTIQGPRYGMTLPLPGVPLSEHRDLLREMADLGYTDLWSAEADGVDAFTPLVLASQPAVRPDAGHRAVTAYLNVPVYAASHEWLGRGDVLAKMWAALPGARRGLPGGGRHDARDHAHRRGGHR